MRSLLCTATAASIALGLAGPVKADPIYFTFDFSGAGVVGSGTLITSFTPDPAAPLGGAYDILSIAGTVNGEAITGLLGTVGPVITSADGFFIYDNDFYVTGSASAAGAFFDIDGLLFTTATSNYNLFFDGANYIYYTDHGAGIDVAFSAVDPPPPISEPASAVLLATGVAGLAVMRRRRARSSRAG